MFRCMTMNSITTCQSGPTTYTIGPGCSKAGQHYKLIHSINHYPVDSTVCFANTYPLDSDLSGGKRYPPFDHSNWAQLIRECLSDSTLPRSPFYQMCFHHSKVISTKCQG